MKTPFTLKPIAIFLLVFSSFFTHDTANAQDQKATNILNGVSRTYKSYKTIKAKFKVTIENKQDKSKSSQSGTLYLKGKKFRVNMAGQEIYCDGKTMWTFIKEVNEVQISNYNPNKEEIDPSEIFTIYQKGFLSRYMGETTRDGKIVQQIELTPKNKNKPYFKVKLVIDKVAKKIVEMTILNKNGINSTYEILDFNPNININDSYFKFDKKDKPGVIEIDLQ